MKLEQELTERTEQKSQSLLPVFSPVRGPFSCPRMHGLGKSNETFSTQASGRIAKDRRARGGNRLTKVVTQLEQKNLEIVALEE